MSFDKFSTTDWGKQGPKKPANPEKARRQAKNVQVQTDEDRRAASMYARTPTSELTPQQQAERDLARRKDARRMNAELAKGSAKEQERLDRMYGKTTPEKSNVPESKLESWYKPKLRP